MPKTHNWLVDFRKCTPEGKVWSGGIRRILTTNPELVTGFITDQHQVVLDSSGLTYQLDGYKGVLTWHISHATFTVKVEDFGPVDTVIVETSLWTPDRHPNCTAPIVDYHLLAGHELSRLQFYKSWRNWVNDPIVRRSVLAFLNSQAVNLGQIWEIYERSSINPSTDRFERDFHKWMVIARVLLPNELAEKILHKTTCRGKTYLAVSTMPIRIATCLGWQPPKESPRPTWHQLPNSLVEVPLS
jgi:hypothetical protein